MKVRENTEKVGKFVDLYERAREIVNRYERLTDLEFDLRNHFVNHILEGLGKECEYVNVGFGSDDAGVECFYGEIKYTYVINLNVWRDIRTKRYIAYIVVDLRKKDLLTDYESVIDRAEIGIVLYPEKFMEDIKIPLTLEDIIHRIASLLLLRRKHSFNLQEAVEKTVRRMYKEEKEELKPIRILQ